MKNLALKILFATTLLAAPAVHAEDPAYDGSQFLNTWEEVKSDPYQGQKLPRTKVSVGSLYHFLKSKIKVAASRTLSDHSDLLPRFDKLAHPNGVCLKGTWEITQANPYSGYFKKGQRCPDDCPLISGDVRNS